MIADEYIGARFGTRVCVGHFVEQRRRILVMLCDCGTEGTVRMDKVKSSTCRTCRPHDSHGYEGTRTYRSWSSMVCRCKNPPHHAYQSYGGRGITFCDKWKRFPGFLEDMGERPEGTSLDRIDNNGNYTKANCRWATQKEQNNNKSSCVVVCVSGEQMTVTQLAEKYKIDRHVLYGRIKQGWPMDRLLEPVRNNRAPRNQS